MDTAQAAMAGWQPVALRADRHWLHSVASHPLETGLAADPAWRLHLWHPPGGARRRLLPVAAAAVVGMAWCIAVTAPVRQPEPPAPSPSAVEMVSEPAAVAVPPDPVAPPPALAPPEPAATASDPQPAAPMAVPLQAAPAAPPALPKAVPVPRATPAPIKPVMPKPVVPIRPQAPAMPEARPAAPPAAAQAEPERAAGPTAGEVAAFQTGMRQAVKAALVYPPAARMAGQKGDVHVGFDYLDGAAANVAITVPSGMPMLDRAAVSTVQSAHFPQPPAAMAHRALHLTITVQFEPGPDP